MAGPYVRRSGKLGRSAWALLAALITAMVLLAAACSSPPRAPTPAGSATIAASTEPTKERIPPDTPAGAQLRWLIAAMSHLSMSEAQVRAYFDAGHLPVVSPDALNQVLEAAGIRRWFAEPIDVLGVSTGGSVALQVAVDHPEVVRRPVRSIRHAGWSRARAAVSASWPYTLLSGTSDAPGSR